MVNVYDSRVHWHPSVTFTYQVYVVPACSPLIVQYLVPASVSDSELLSCEPTLGWVCIVYFILFQTLFFGIIQLLGINMNMIY